MVSNSDSAGDRKSASRPVSRVLSMRGCPPLDDHSSGTPVAGRFTQPTRAAGPETALGPCKARATPIRSCSRWGLPCRPRCRKRGALLPHHFTLASGRSPVPRFHFCGTVPGVAPAGRYPAPCFHGARTFLPRTLSGLAAAVIQPAGGTKVGAGGRGQMMVWRAVYGRDAIVSGAGTWGIAARGGSGRLRGGFLSRAERVARALPSAGIEDGWSKAPVQRPRPAGLWQNARRFETGSACRPVALKARGS